MHQFRVSSVLLTPSLRRSHPELVSASHYLTFKYAILNQVQDDCDEDWELIIQMKP